MAYSQHNLDWRPVLAESQAMPSAVDSRRRLRLLRWVFLLGMSVVFARVVQLDFSQGDLARQIAAAPGTRGVPLPATRGRILASDGTLLAYDRTGPALAVHYRWLEEPANDVWLKRTVRRRLTAVQRRDAARVAQETNTVLSERAALHRQLAQLCNLSESQWFARCLSIQTEVERVTRLVNLRRDAKRQAAEVNTTEQPESIEAETSAVKTWHKFWQELTAKDTDTDSLAPIIVAEALDYHVLVENLSLSAAEQIERTFLPHPGLQIKELRTRHYPGETLAAHLIGHLGPPNADELKRNAALSEELVGRDGLEFSKHAQLRGKPGTERQVLSRAGDVLSRKVITPPQQGTDIKLTLDARLQQAAEHLLDSALSRKAILNPDSAALPAGGAVVVLDCTDGAVLTLAAAPRYRPIHFSRGDSNELSQLLTAADKPLLNRAIAMAIPPGSVMKVITAAALLEGNIVQPEAPFYCQGYLNQPDELRCMLFRHQGVGHEDLNLAGALAVSCNTYFFHFAPKLGGQRLTQWSAMFGLGQKTGIELPGESSGHLPTPGQMRREYGTSWNETDSRSVSIGQGTLTATPLQVARAIGVIATEGKLLSPHLLSHADSQPNQQSSSQWLPAAGLSRQSLHVLRRGMQQAVNDPAGTAHASLSGLSVSVAAKTGTAESGRDRPDHAWIACYAPAEAPSVVIVVALEHAGSGSQSAGPIARRVVQQLDELGYFRVKRIVQSGK